MVSKPTYADDVALITNNPLENQCSIEIFQEAINWSGCFKLRVKKCRSFASMVFSKKCVNYKKHLNSKSYSSFDPLLVADGKTILFIGNDAANDSMFKYIGHFIQSDFGSDKVAALLNQRIKKCMALIDDSELTGPMKCWILHHYVFSKASWIIMVHDLKLGQLDIWQNAFHRKYRSWLGLAKSCEPSVIYRSKENFGLSFHDAREYSKRLKVARMHMLKTSSDPKIRKLYGFFLKRDKKRRGVSSSLRKFNPPKKRQSQLPPTLELEKALCPVKFLKVKGNCQKTKRGLRAQRFFPCSFSMKSSKAERKLVSLTLKKGAESTRMQKLFNRNYQMKTTWLANLDKVIADNLA